MTNEPVQITTDKPLRLSAEGMRALKKATGRGMSELLNDEDDEANRLQVMAFSELHRRATHGGHMPDAATLWEEAGTVEVEFSGPVEIDPLGSASSITSPPSAVTGA